jgi:hypothetical protein
MGPYLRPADQMKPYNVADDCGCGGFTRKPACSCPCHHPWRQSIDGGGAEKDWTPGEMHALYYRGFKHGVCGSAMDQ